MSFCFLPAFRFCNDLTTGLVSEPHGGNERSSRTDDDDDEEEEREREK